MPHQTDFRSAVIYFIFINISTEDIVVTVCDYHIYMSDTDLRILQKDTYRHNNLLLKGAPRGLGACKSSLIPYVKN